MALHLNQSCNSETADHAMEITKVRDKENQSLSPSFNKFSFALSSGVTPVESETGVFGTSRRIPNLSMDSVKATPMESTQLESTLGTCNTFLSTVNSLSASDASSHPNQCDEQADELNRPITSPNDLSSPVHLRAETMSPNLPLLVDSPQNDVDVVEREDYSHVELLETAYPPMPVVANRTGSTKFGWNGSGEAPFPSPSSHTLDPPVELPSLLAFQAPEIPSPSPQTMSTTHQHTITRRIENTIIKNAIIHRCSVKNCHITNCQITDSKCEGGFLGTCKMVNTKLKNIPLITSSLLDRCLVKGCRLTNTVMRQGAVKGCRVIDSNLKQVGAYYNRLTRTHLIQCEFDFDEQIDCVFDDCRREGDPEQYFGAKNAKEMRINIGPKQGQHHPQQKNLADVLQSLKTDQQLQQHHPHHHIQKQQPSDKPRVSNPPVLAVGNEDKLHGSALSQQTKVRSSGCCVIQ